MNKKIGLAICAYLTTAPMTHASTLPVSEQAVLEDMIGTITKRVCKHADSVSTTNDKEGNPIRTIYTITPADHTFSVVFNNYAYPEEDIMEFIYYPEETKHLPQDWYKLFSSYKQLFDPYLEPGSKDILEITYSGEGRSVQFIDFEGDGFLKGQSGEHIFIDSQLSRDYGLEGKTAFNPEEQSDEVKQKLQAIYIEFLDIIDTKLGPPDPQN